MMIMMMIMKLMMMQHCCWSFVLGALPPLMDGRRIYEPGAIEYYKHKRVIGSPKKKQETESNCFNKIS